MPRLTLALATSAIAVLLATPSHATLNACSAGKKQCVSKKTAGLLKCHILAEKAGLDPVSDPTIQACLQKVVAKFDGGATPSKGCFAKLEAKFSGGCLTTSDTTALESKVDAFVTDTVTELDPGYPAPVTNTCSVGKKKCVSKKAAGLLTCHVKNEKPPGVTPVDFAACLQRVRDKFDGGGDPSKGCFAKLEAKFPGGCLTTNDTAALETKVDAFVNDVVCELDPGSGTCPPATPTPTPTATPTPTTTPTPTLTPSPTPTPPPCGNILFPTCNGTCPVGQQCFSDGQFAACRCADPAHPPCNSITNDQCEQIGTCPPSMVCSNVGPHFCACF